MVFPAGAGMNRPLFACAKDRESVPRRRGDEPYSEVESGGPVECSPQARG